MAQQIDVNVYQINSLDPIPLGNVQKNLFPVAGFLGRPIINPTTGVPGLLLSTGVYVYTQLQLLATGAVYSVAETPTAINQMSNA
jgi:hypothetical protein